MLSKRGFTLVEVLIYASALAITGGLLTAVLSNTITIKTREANSTELAQQLSFVMGTIQSLVNESSIIEAVYETGQSEGTACTNLCTLKLRMPSNTGANATYVHATTTGVYLTENASAPSTSNPLTGTGVTVDRFKLTKYEFEGGHASVQVDMALTISSSSPRFAVTRDIQSAIGRATAATFDSDLIPNADNTYDVGSATYAWQDGVFDGTLTVAGNSTFDTNTLFVNAANNRIGIGTTAPEAVLHLEDLTSTHMAMTLENADVVAGMELETQSATAADEAIFNIGVMTERGIPLKSATNPDAAWMRIDTRSSTKNFSWYWEAAGAGTELQLMFLSDTGDLALREKTAPSNTSGYGKLYVSSADSLLHFVDDGGTGHALLEDVKCVYIAYPTATDDLKSIWTANGFAATLTKIWCESDQTVNADLQVDDGTPADVDGVDLVCDSTPPEDESLGGDPTMADGDRLDLAIASVSGNPTWFSMCWSLVYNE